MVEIFKALAEENRLRILSLLLNKELCVCEIEAVLGSSQSNISRHLILLKRSGIIKCRKSAQWSYYSISGDFKHEHSALWLYLSEHLKELSTYSSDIKLCEKFKSENICLRIGKEGCDDNE